MLQNSDKQFARECSSLESVTTFDTGAVQDR